MSAVRIFIFAPAPDAMKRARGASRLELLIAVVVIGIVAGLLLERLTRYQEYAEKTVMEATIANMRSGLRVRVAELMISGQMARMGDLLEENPITWLAAPPANYAGPLPQADNSQPVPGHWYFDATQQELVYLPRHRRFFQPEGGAIEVRLQVLGRTPGAGLTRTPPAMVEGVSLVLATPYRWNRPI